MARDLSMKNVKVVDSIGETIELTGEFLDEGRHGIVMAGRFRHGPQFDVAVKFYVPMANEPLFSTSSGFPTFAASLLDRHAHELSALRAIAHPNVQQYVSSGLFVYDKSYFGLRCPALQVGTDVPFIASRLIRGDRLDRLLAGAPSVTSRAQLVSHLLGAARGLEHLHAKGVLHADVRSANVIVEGQSQTPILLDFGLAKILVPEDKALTPLVYDPTPLPKSVVKALQQTASDQKRQWPSHLIRAILFPYLDLFQFAALIRETLDSAVSRSLRSFDREYLTLIADALTPWECEVSGSMPVTTIRGGIPTSQELVERLGKLAAGPSYFRRKLDENEVAPPRTIVRQSGTAEIRESVAPFLSHPTLRRLHNIHQLALLHYVYPSAGQSRFDHSLSTLARAQELWAALSRSPRFLFHMGWKDIDRLELAALLHDINHFPFLHYFQEAGIEAISRARVLDIVVRHDSARQDEGGAGGTGGSLEAQLEERELSLEYLRSLLGPLADRFRAPVADQIIMSIMNSAVDADKLAYLPDDALFSGLPFGKGIDLHGILDGIDVEEVTIPGGNVTWHIVFSQEALPAVESVCFARYWNFQRLYWHHTNRAIASMIIYTIRALYSRGDASPEEYLRQTWNLGEAGALRFLENEYARLSGHEAPIHGLATNRDRIYKRVFEMTLSGAELDKAALKFQDTEAAAKNRDEAQRRIFEIVKDIVLTHSDIRRKVEPSDVVLDVPLRRMDLGGELFFRMAGGRIERGTDVSRPLHELEQNFNHMSKILRVYVAPWIRDAVARSVWEDPSRFGARVVDVLRGGQSSEVS